jgi:hypothetical protein
MSSNETSGSFRQIEQIYRLSPRSSAGVAALGAPQRGIRVPDLLLLRLTIVLLSPPSTES